MQRESSHRAAIIRAVRAAIGANDDEIVLPEIYTARLRNGERVYRSTAREFDYGRKPAVFFDHERNTIYGRVHYGLVPLHNEDEAAKHILRWHWHLYHKGRHALTAAVQAAIEQELPGATVTLGNGSTGHHGSLAVLVPKEAVERRPLHVALFGAMPPVGSVWPAAERQKWLDMAAAMIAVFYRE